MNKKFYISSLVALVFGILFFVKNENFFGGVIEEYGGQGADEMGGESPKPYPSGRGENNVNVNKAPVKDRFEILYKFDAEGFDLAWETVLESEGDERSRILALSIVVGRMVSLGHADQALQKVKREFGHGRNRVSLIESCFRSMKSIQKLEESLSLLDDERDLKVARESATSLILGALISKDPQLLNDEKVLDFLGADLASTMNTACQSYFYHETKKGLGEAHLRSVLAEITSSVYGGILDKSFYMTVGIILPFEAWDIVHKDDGVSENQKKKLIKTMVGKDHVRALDVLSDGLHVSNDVLNGVKFLGDLDEKAAYDWVEKNEEKFTDDVRDGVYAGLVNLAKDRLDFPVAWVKLKEISDPDFRVRIEGEMWAAEKKVVGNKVMADPQGAVASIVNGDSGHADYWLEESIGTWLEKDAGAVNEWYEENWKSLSPEETQYVAAAFAQEAVKLGDVGTAIEWAERIQNPKTRERIEGVIQKAQQK